MLARLSALVIWALVAAAAVFWGLRLLVKPPAPPAYAVAVGDAGTVRGDLAKLLGTAPIAPPAASIAAEAGSRFRLLGIVAPDAAVRTSAASTRGVALIAVDGKMPKAYLVGARVDGDLVLQTVSLRSASIAASGGAPTITLELPRPVSAATGSLPSIGGSALGATPPAIVPQYVPAPAPFVLPPAMGAPGTAPAQGTAPNS